MINLAQHFLDLFIESAPWLLLGLLVAGVMKTLVPQDWLGRQLGKPGFASTLKAALLGAPLPLCSCGVIPAALGLRRAGASKSATTSFLISTPETGVDSISVSYALLGPFMAIIRPIAAISSALTAGLLVDTEKSTSAQSTTTAATSCCASKRACSSGTSDKPTAQREQTMAQKLAEGFRFSFTKLLGDIALWLLIGLGAAAVIKTFVPAEFLAQWGDGLLAFVVMAIIGVPMYVCATASTPMAAGLLFSGVSPGAVLVFMLVSPATNVATVALVKKELGGRALAAYLTGVIGVGFVFGFLTNWLTEQWQIDFAEQASHSHQLVSAPLAYTAAAVLALLMARSLMQRS